MRHRLVEWAKAIKRDLVAVWLAARDPRVPWHAKLLAGMVAAYALSPIDLIPDFIPVLGYLDDIIFVPLGLWLAVRLIPRDVMADLRARASSATAKPTSRAAAAVVIAIWIVGSVAAAALLWRFLSE